MKNQVLLKTAVALFIISLVLTGIILAQYILIPLAVSTLIAYLLLPIVSRIERIGFHRIISIIMVIIMALVVVSIIAFYFSFQVSRIQIDLQKIKEKVVEKSDSPKEKIEKKFGVNMRTMDYYFDQTINGITGAISEGSGNIFSTTATTVFQILILPVFTFFLLFYRTKTAYFIFRLVGRKHKRKALKILREISTVANRYLAGLLGVVLILAVLNTLGLTIIGVPHAVVLGVGAAFLNLIPYFGTLMGALIPILYVLISMPHPLNTAIQVAIMFIIVQFLENNVITPNVVGGNVSLNALTIILGLLFGNLIWGIAGMLVIIPFIAILKIIMRNIDSLKPFAYLLSARGLSKQKINYKRSLMRFRVKVSKLWRRKN